MRRILIISMMLCCAMNIMADKNSESVEGTSYYLPKTALKFKILIEKSVYTPGEYAVYSERFLKESASTEAYEEYRILNIKMESFGIPDTSKIFTAKVDAKHSITSLAKDDGGILLAVNADAKVPELSAPFVPATKQAPLNPRDYMTQDILSAGSTAKMAELTALEIYDTRDSKNQLNKGQADFMPKDGEQLRIMLENLNTQERALTQLFHGTTVKDTVETEIIFVPEKETDKEVLFRFSRRLGLVDSDDLAGSPYYLSVEDMHNIPVIATTVEPGEKNKDDAGIYVNLPGKIKISLYKGTDLMAGYELYAAQFGHTAAMQGELFGKRLFTQITVNQVTGNVDSIKTEMVKK